MHRSVYQLKEADPHTFVVPRVQGSRQGRARRAPVRRVRRRPARAAARHPVRRRDGRVRPRPQLRRLRRRRARVHARAEQRDEPAVPAPPAARRRPSVTSPRSRSPARCPAASTSRGCAGSTSRRRWSATSTSTWRPTPCTSRSRPGTSAPALVEQEPRAGRGRLLRGGGVAADGGAGRRARAGLLRARAAPRCAPRWSRRRWRDAAPSGSATATSCRERRRPRGAGLPGRAVAGARRGRGPRRGRRRCTPTTRPVVAVCACARSQRAPWCDGTHKVVTAAARR